MQFCRVIQRVRAAVVNRRGAVVPVGPTDKSRRQRRQPCRVLVCPLRAIESVTATLCQPATPTAV